LMILYYNDDLSKYKKKGIIMIIRGDSMNCLYLR